MTQFNNRRYTYTNPFGSPNHEWSVVGPRAAIHFHVSVNAQYGDTAGLEIHYFEAPEYMKDHAPSHLDCRFTGGRCWHDGTSLYAMETLWPMIRSLLGDHETVFRILESDYETRFQRKGDAA